MTHADLPQHPPTDVTQRELAVEQLHVDRVYVELSKAADRAALVQADGMFRVRSDRTGEVRDEELTGLFERDALVHTAARRTRSLDQQHEGLVFGRLDLQHSVEQRAVVSPTGMDGREVRYIGRLGVRDDDYEPLVIDWRAPAAAPFYQATPREPFGVLRRRVLRCRGERVIGAEDDLMVAQAPDDLVILGDGALIAALARSRHGRMRDIVATIQADQDRAIRAPARGITEITGGPGTGKTVVALHRAAYLLYSERRRFEGGGVLVVGPSAAYTAYIERVLPSLGEESVVLRSVGDIVDAATATRHDSPVVAAVKGSLRIRRVLARAARDLIPGSPPQLRVFVAGRPIRLDARGLARCRSRVLRGHRRNSSRSVMALALAEAAWSSDPTGDRDQFLAIFLRHPAVETFLDEWWRPVDPREVLLWLADKSRAHRYGAGVLADQEVAVLRESLLEAERTGSWSVADIALIDDLAALLGLVPEAPREAEFYQVEELDELAEELARSSGATQPGRAATLGRSAGRDLGPTGVGRTHPAWPNGRDALLYGRVETPAEFAHVLVDEAQDLSPMQWRMVARRGRWASWTVVGDAAQASWPDAAEAEQAKDEVFAGKNRARFHMTTNYRNSREIFDYAADVIRRVMPDADIPEAVRDTGVGPVEVLVTGRTPRVSGDRAAEPDLPRAVQRSVEELREQVDGLIAVIAPERWRAMLADEERKQVLVIDPLSTKGLEYDATVVVDPDEIAAESPGGVRGLYVALTRAAHRMHVVRVSGALGSGRPDQPPGLSRSDAEQQGG
ncbi:MAG TPA: ATP-binding domain-containing protein [Dermatophilaceae bacterium]|nr:ATP-binding domain-containing protein [Dermatophilaceae bacterium]